MSAADLLLRLGTDNTPFNRGLAQARAAGAKWGNDLSHELSGKIRNVFGAAAVVEGVREFSTATIEHVKNIKHMAEQYSITTDEAQRVGIATKRLELEDSQFGQVLLKTNEARKKANEGNEELRSTFQKYGASVNDTLNPQLTTISLLNKMFGTVEEGKMSFEDQNELMEIFGLRGVKMVAVIKMLAQVNEERHPLINEEEIDRVDKATHKFEEYVRLAKVAATVKAVELIENPAQILSWASGLSAVNKLLGIKHDKAVERLTETGGGDTSEMPLGSLHAGLIKARRIVQDDPLERKRNMDEDAQYATAQEKYWTAQEKFAVARLGPMEREKQLRKKLIELQEEQKAEGEAVFPDRAKILELKAQQLDARTELFGLTKAERPNDASPLQRVGNFLGAGDDRPLQQFRLTNTHLAQIKASLITIQQNGGV